MAVSNYNGVFIMAKDKLIPTWLKIAAVAALIVPYSVKLEKDEAERIKKVSALPTIEITE